MSVLLVSLGAVSADASEAPAQAVDPSAVTAANLLDRERFWPYRVTLTEAWQPPGREAPLRAGSTGVLIRIETDGAARIDFSADGKYEVPVDKTDLLENANRIRRGELDKAGPNFVHAIATRLVDSASDSLTGLKPEVVADRPGFLCVFADPSAEEFEDLAAALRPLKERHGVLTILFPQGSHPDAATRERLRALEWTVPFLYDFLAEPYTRTLLADGIPLPAVVLQTNEGRALYQRTWQPNAVEELISALDAAFAGDASLLEGPLRRSDR
jgi:hypothetical protein